MPSFVRRVAKHADYDQRDFQVESKSSEFQVRQVFFHGVTESLDSFLQTFVTARGRHEIKVFGSGQVSEHGAPDVCIKIKPPGN